MQCDGGIALGNAQIQVLILSVGQTYVTDDSFIRDIEKRFSPGFFHIENAEYKTIFGTYYEFKKGDGRSNPSIRRPFSIDYKTKKVTFDE